MHEKSLRCENIDIGLYYMLFYKDMMTILTDEIQIYIANLRTFQLHYQTYCNTLSTYTKLYTDSGAIKDTFFFYIKPFCKIILALYIYINVHSNASYSTKLSAKNINELTLQVTCVTCDVWSLVQNQVQTLVHFHCVWTGYYLAYYTDQVGSVDFLLLQNYEKKELFLL